MAEYIERKSLLKELDAYFDETDPTGEEQIGVLKSMRIIREQPAADVVEVVRCKDCMYWRSGENAGEQWEWCAFHNQGIGPHAFCSLGTRRDDHE